MKIDFIHFIEQISGRKKNESNDMYKSTAYLINHVEK